MGTPVHYKQADIRALEQHLEGIFEKFPAFIKRLAKAHVLIKPNLVRPDPTKLPAMTTDPRLLHALIRTCLHFNAAHVTLGEKPGYGFPARKAFELIGLTPEHFDQRVSFSYFDEEQWQRKPNPGADVFRQPLIPKQALDCDLIINVPKMKTHMHTLVSLGLKNFQGLVADDERMLFHRCDISHKIVDTVLARKPDFTIIDALWPMEGQAPFFGDPVCDFNVLVASENVVAADATCCRIMGIEPTEITHIRLAALKGLGPLGSDQIKLLGCSIKKIQRYFKRPIISSVAVFPPITVIEGGVCLGCLSAIRHSLDKCHFEKMIERLKPLTLYVGRSMPNQPTLTDWQGDLWLFGNCAVEIMFPELKKRTKPHFIPGCPPHVLDLHLALSRMYNL